MKDIDPEETGEWIESFDELVEEHGTERAQFIVRSLLQRAGDKSIEVPLVTTTDYVNTIPVDQEPEYPGDEAIERRYRAIMRWNAAVMVQRAQKSTISVGGHISSYAGQSTMYEIGYNHFFRGRNHPGGGDQIFFQGHSSPGNYARAFLEGRLTEEQLDGFRQEKTKEGNALPSYPHPRNMPEFWQFPTVSMGLGPLNAIHQAQFNKYLHNRGIKDTSEQHVWAFLGDGEMDEPESRGALQLAANDKLDNLTFVVNCNLQRLDGPVRGNGKIVQELEAYFRGAGWNVIKVLWGREWDALLEKDKSGELVRIMNEALDGDYQTYKAESGGFIREHFFGRSPETKELVADMTDEEIWAMKRGAHDYHKVYAAYKRAMETKGKPTVILAQSVKGYGLGTHFEGRNATHQMKKLTMDDLKIFRDRLHIPITDEELEKDLYNPPYYRPDPDSPEMKYLMERRKELGGFIPGRLNEQKEIPLPSEKAYKGAKKGTGKQMAATTMAFVRLLKDLMREKDFGDRIVPIIPDEARTFGMDSYFPTAKIYNPNGQNYTAVDRELMLAYKESPEGKILHVGINEAGGTAALTAAGTSYDTHGVPMVPVYIFYSMFGFQRTGDAFWAAGDQLARGFIIGGTAGRTTLTGEGLQHMDGHSPILASTNPAVIHYDPAYGYELAHIVERGIEQMYGTKDEDHNVMYYITVYNEPIVHPAEPENLDVEGLIGGIYRVSESEVDGPRTQLLASGVAVPWALEAQKLLAEDWGVSADVWSVTSWTKLRRDGLEAEETSFLTSGKENPTPFIAQQMEGATGPIVAVSDFASDLMDPVRQYVPNDFATLGADGWGFSDTRAGARRFFHIDSHSIAVRALQMLAKRGEISADIPAKAFEQYKLDDVNAGTSGNAGGDA
ncbi:MULTISPECIES: pyruvate dehydrogenase (acetyl-transferring), homodimeric type [unclassified Rothia (in: high G+C Gram-positive bacteria)]|uniref:pyruvate dehydrogenase (acetyl-transferring), homodimeric type n=1 Tax=unclassified Rothia (in: high G+C Gram-positive bacteria) TaxID=2689056 RepID=UPI00195DF89D|nr:MULTISPECIES: pyruvate dehydrogenase (acetyl-transferring), homodimeric type [unclassified Rothia (in: high G+C Gram-positive bacteria)]MBM7050894.1 pyruvate dehydrogenase (acetyl-transferring), homodimeric type [Rothia sp. ZJ1223]QRZ62574.1 pyruvate dehydrogenase (acetyl-transferring), homodimeric type [Rothia sp. ZJ932]